VINKVMPVIYLILFPIAGAAVGYVFYCVYLLLGNQASSVVLNMFIIVWVLFGIFVGRLGTRWFKQVNRNLDKK